MSDEERKYRAEHREIDKSIDAMAEFAKWYKENK